MKMKIDQYVVDWKEDFELKIINKIAAKVGGKKCIQIHGQDKVDDKVMYINSRTLTQKEMKDLWEIGDIWCWTGPIEGRTFQNILEKIKSLNSISKIEDILWCKTFTDEELKTKNIDKMTDKQLLAKYKEIYGDKDPYTISED